MKKLLLLSVGIIMMMSCQPEPGPQPVSQNQTNPNTNIASTSDTVDLLVGVWYWDSVVQYNAGVRTLISSSPSAGGWGGAASQSMNFTMTKYNGQGNGSAIGTNYCESFHTIGTSTGTLYQWAVQRQYPMNNILATGYFGGNIHLLTSNRLVVTDWSGSGTKNGLFYYHHK